MLVSRKVKGSDPDQSEIEEGETEERKVFLRNSGKINLPLSASGKLKPSSTEVGEPLCTIINYPVRGRVWHFERIAFHGITGDVAIADERGQIYTINMKDSTYRTSRFASTTITALEYIHSRATQLVVAYESGKVIIIDTFCCSRLHCNCPKDIIANIQPEGFGIPSTQRIIKCHPSKPFAVMLSDDLVLTLWDLRTPHCALTLDCTEPVVGIQYERDGDLLAVCFEHSGLSIFRTSDCSKVMSCSLPQNERMPKWTGIVL